MSTVLLTNLQAGTFIIPGVRPIKLSPGETKRFDASTCKLPELEVLIKAGWLLVIQEDAIETMLMDATLITSTVSQTDDTVEIIPESLTSMTMTEPVPLKLSHSSRRTNRNK